MTRLFVISALPPPIHGQSLVTSRLCALLTEAGVEIEPIDTSPRTFARGRWGYHTRRIRGHAAAVVRCLLYSKRFMIYANYEAGFGAGYTFILLLLAAVCRAKIILHLHSPVPARTPYRVLRLVTLWMKRNVVLICLCDQMAAEVRKNYSQSIETIVINNACFLDITSYSLTERNRRGFNLGFIGNISIEKGIDVVLATCSRLLTDRDDMVLHLAGPILDELSQLAVARFAEEFPTRVVIYGSLHGNAKVAFFAELDFFLMPSMYRNEAQPLVIIEAMAFGVVPVSSDCGYIGELQGQAGAVFPIKCYVEEAASFINITCSRFPVASTEARSRFEYLQKSAKGGIIRLLETIFE